jgi:hypothetical protein
MTVVRCPAMPEGPQLAHPARSAYDRFPALSGRSWDQPRRGAWGRFEPFAIQLGNDCYLRIPALPGTQRERLLRVDSNRLCWMAELGAERQIQAH